MGGRGPCFGDPRISVGVGVREIYVSHIDVSWVQCYKTISRDETLSRFVRGEISNGLREPEVAASAANLSTVRLSSGVSANNTGLPPPAKACPKTDAGGGPAARPVTGASRSHSATAQGEERGTTTAGGARG